MNINDKISTIMSKHLVTVSPKDSMLDVKKIFDEYKFHHIPVVEFKGLVGIISKSDLLHFQRKYYHQSDTLTEIGKLRAFKVEELMTNKVAVLEPEDSIGTALEIFKENQFHCIPIVSENELIGMITPYDVMSQLLVDAYPDTTS